MSFGLVQLGQAATSLGERELAYHCLKHLVNRFWLNNLASMHNHRSLFNMDISGGMPAVIIKMLVDSAPGHIRLLPALPDAWPEGQIEGVLCRGAIEIESLSSAPGRVQVTMRSARPQSITLELPADIVQGQRTGAGDPVQVRPTNSPRQRQVELPGSQPVTLQFVLTASD